MSVIQTIHLSVLEDSIPQTIPAVQNDTDRSVKMIIDDLTLTSGMTGTLNFKRSDGSHYGYTATLDTSDNSFTAPLDQALTQPGRTYCQLKVTDSDVVSTFTFIVNVTKDVSGTVTPQEGIDLVSAVQAAEDAADRAEQAASMFDEDVQGYVDDWLDDHPEATTTVQDGSLTEAKFSDALKLKTIKDYVTPEMFGAKGDGVTDDTNALRSCIASNNYVLLKGTYLITGVLNFNGIHDFVMYGGKIVRPLNATYNTIVGDHCNNVTISNVKFDGNGNDRTMSYTWKDNAQACIILASQSRNIFIEKCEVKNYNYGIFILGSDVENEETSYDNTSLNGVIRDCTFYNCNSAIDTYGKGILIDHNIFYGITNHGIQIEPNYTLSVVDNPLDDTNYYTSALACTVSNNLLIDIDNAAIVVHGQNSYAVNVINNTIIDFYQAILFSNSSLIRYATVQDNYIYYQKPQTVDADKRPWSYVAAIGIGGGSVIIANNHIWKAYVGIYVRGKENVVNNVIESPIISAIVFYYTSSLSGEMTNISDNKIKNHVLNQSAYWGARAIVIGDGTNLIIKNNFVETNAQPIFRASSVTAIVVGLVSTTAQTEAITLPSGFNTYSNLS